MKKISTKNIALWICACCMSMTTTLHAQDFQKVCAEKSKTSGIAVKGLDEWQFLKSELRHLSVGEFWGEKSAQTSMAANAAQKDPLTAIVNYHKTLEKENVRLLLVPVPPKAVIYPDKLATGLTAKRYDSSLQKFYDVLKSKGVEV